MISMSIQCSIVEKISARYVWKMRNLICLRFKLITLSATKDIRRDWMSDSCQHFRAQKLKKVFPNPRETITKILNPLIKPDPVQFEPKLHIEQTKYTKHWKCRLDLRWPRNFSVHGCGKDPNEVEEYCYLQACDMFKFLGFLDHDGNIVRHKKIILDLHDDVCEINIQDIKKMSLKFSSMRKFINGRKIWTSTLNMDWPLEIYTQAIGHTQDAAENNAAALAWIKLRGSCRVSCVSSKIFMSYIQLPRNQHKDSDYAYTIFVDASLKGYGAYLVPHSSEEQSTIPWFSIAWDTPPTKSPQNLKNSNYIEFYAVLGAVFTWKHHFKDKKVLVCSDSADVVRLIKHGLPRNGWRHHKIKRRKYKDIFVALCYACLANRICLEAEHVCRTENMAADYLSRQQLDLFHELIPQASKHMKKPKYLNFIKTLNSDAR